MTLQAIIASFLIDHLDDPALERRQIHKDRDAELLRLGDTLGGAKSRLAPITERRCGVCNYDRAHHGQCSWCGNVLPTEVRQ